MRRAAESTDAIKRHLAGTQGLLDNLPAEQVRDFETFLYDWLDRTDTGLLKQIRDVRALSDALRDALTDAVQHAKAEFLAPRSPGTQERDVDHEDGGEA